MWCATAQMTLLVLLAAASTNFRFFIPIYGPFLYHYGPFLYGLPGLP